MSRIISVPDRGDDRGSSRSVPPEVFEFLGAIADIHLTTLVPGAVRGNHFHTRRREALIIVHSTGWTFHWDDGENAPSQHREFTEAGATIILIEPGHSHAIENSGESSLSVMGLSTEPYDPTETKVRDVAGRS